MKDENSTKINEKNYESPESNTSTKDLQTVELNKHKQIPSCLNNCINWKLRAKMNNDKKNENIDIKEYEFNGKSLFFKKLNASILNILQNNFENILILQKVGYYYIISSLLHQKYIYL